MPARRFSKIPSRDIVPPISVPPPRPKRPVVISRPNNLSLIVNEESVIEPSSRRPSDMDVEKCKEEKKKNWLLTELDRFDSSVNHRSELYLLWSIIVSIACLYNLIFSTILVYKSMQSGSMQKWLRINISCDVIYILDMVVHSRKNFYMEGVKVSNRFLMLKRYLTSRYFCLDCISLLPLDILMIFMPNMSMLRFNRFFKCYRLRDTIELIEIKTSWHTAFSLIKIVLACVILFHWNACLYYGVSSWSYTVMAEVTDDDWPFTLERVSDMQIAKCNSYPCSEELFDEANRDIEEREEYAIELYEHWANRTNHVKSSLFAKEYAQTFYWSSLTMTTLGEQPSPNLSEHNLLEIFDTLVGILIFAAIMGSVADLISQSNALKSSHQQLADGLKQYMSYRYLVQDIRRNMPSKLFLRVNHFMHPNIFEDSDIFKGLNEKFLREVASKMKLYQFVPQDKIVSIGDFNKEMFLLCSGTLAVIGRSGGIKRIMKEQGEIIGDSTLIWFEGDVWQHRCDYALISKGFSEVSAVRKGIYRMKHDLEEQTELFKLNSARMKKRVSELEDFLGSI